MNERIQLDKIKAVPDEEDAFEKYVATLQKQQLVNLSTDSETPIMY